jgi:hypothetical protein
MTRLTYKGKVIATLKEDFQTVKSVLEHKQRYNGSFVLKDNDMRVMSIGGEGFDYANLAATTEKTVGERIAQYFSCCIDWEVYENKEAMRSGKPLNDANSGNLDLLNIIASSYALMGEEEYNCARAEWEPISFEEEYDNKEARILVLFLN